MRSRGTCHHFAQQRREREAWTRRDLARSTGDSMNVPWWDARSRCPATSEPPSISRDEHRRWIASFGASDDGETKRMFAEGSGEIARARAGTNASLR
jgi:hypothetical protein